MQKLSEDKSVQKKRRLVVLGAGESGVGAAILAKDKGMEVFVSDFGKVADKYAAVLDNEGIRWEQGGHNMQEILMADEVVKSPGIPPTAPVVMALSENKIPILSEIEFAARYTDATMICITGSNGKTTTTLLTYHILIKAGLDVGLAGNVGKSLAFQVSRAPHKVYVIELSSFQLENMYDFKAHIAMMLNITPDHLDRYDFKMQNYIDAKFRILQNMTSDDNFVYWQDCPVIRQQLAERLTTEAKLMPFAEKRERSDYSWCTVTSCGFIDQKGDIEIDTPVNSLVMPREQLSLSGLHNLYNSMAATTACCLMGVAPDVICEGLNDFPGVEHRLEFVADIDGVRYINDSKATNVDSTWYALESMKGKNTVLILGGKDKGNDYSQIEQLVREKVKAIVCMGVHNEKLLDFFNGKVDHIEDTHSLSDAIDACRRLSSTGDTVLLSPCCASFDLFKSYEDRGEQFKEKVRAIGGHNKA